MSENNESGTPAVREKAILAVIHDEWVAGGSKKPDKKTNRELITKWEQAERNRKATEKAFQEAALAETEAVKAIVRANGKGRMRINGRTFIPMSRGKTVFFREEGVGEVRDIG